MPAKLPQGQTLSSVLKRLLAGKFFLFLFFCVLIEKLQR